MNKIRVIIKRPDEEYGHVTYISDKLENLQKYVGGNIEIVEIGSNGAVMICNEEGKIQGLEKNFIYGITFPQAIVGTVIVCGTEGEDLADLPFTLTSWKMLLKMWGN